MKASFSKGLHNPGGDACEDRIWIFLGKERFVSDLAFPVESTDELRALAENLLRCAKEIDEQ